MGNYDYTKIKTGYYDYDYTKFGKADYDYDYNNHCNRLQMITITIDYNRLQPHAWTWRAVVTNIWTTMQDRLVELLSDASCIGNYEL